MGFNMRLFSFIFFLLNAFIVNAIEIFEVKIKDHIFIPDKIEVPAGTKFKLLILNLDSQVEEFESFDLRREKIVPANGKITLNIGPLTPGEYNFFGDFHKKTALGILIAK